MARFSVLLFARYNFWFKVHRLLGPLVGADAVHNPAGCERTRLSEHRGQAGESQKERKEEQMGVVKRLVSQCCNSPQSDLCF